MTLLTPEESKKIRGALYVCVDWFELIKSVERALNTCARRGVA